MSATQELIAASLTLADMDERVAEMPTQAAADVREACARAMVQPDVSEVERLVDDFGDACDPFARNHKYSSARNALLDAVRAIVAERDALREAAKMVSDANDPDPLHLSRILHELAGAASMCWTPRPSTAVFDSQQALVFVEQSIAEIRQRMQMMSATPQPVGEVPMPEPDMVDQQSYVFAHSTGQMRTYGEQCRATGYAAGVAAGGKDAVERWKAEVDMRPLENKHRRTLDDVWRQVIAHTGGDPVALIGPCHDALAALRGEVK